jgi:hypothetical protein
VFILDGGKGFSLVWKNGTARGWRAKFRRGGDETYNDVDASFGNGFGAGGFIAAGAFRQ